MKCFISQRMAGLTDQEILERRAEIEAYVRFSVSDDVEFISSFIEEDAPKNVNPGIWYLGKSIELLAQADLFVISKDALGSRGCDFEYNIARSYDIKILIV